MLLRDIFFVSSCAGIGYGYMARDTSSSSSSSLVPVYAGTRSNPATLTPAARTTAEFTSTSVPLAVTSTFSNGSSHTSTSSPPLAAQSDDATAPLITQSGTQNNLIIILATAGGSAIVVLLVVLFLFVPRFYRHVHMHRTSRPSLDCEKCATASASRGPSGGDYISKLGFWEPDSDSQPVTPRTPGMGRTGNESQMSWNTGTLYFRPEDLGCSVPSPALGIGRASPAWRDSYVLPVLSAESTEHRVIPVAPPMDFAQLGSRAKLEPLRLAVKHRPMSLEFECRGE